MFIQLPLKMGLREAVSFDTFVSPDTQTELALARFQTSLQKSRGETFYLQGPKGAGKTHLLQAACRLMSEQQQQSVYLPLADPELPLIADVLHGLEKTHLICLDDVEQVVGDADWDQALTRLLSRARSLGHSVVLSGEADLSQWPTQRSELSQSLMSVLPISIPALTDPRSLVQALQKQAGKLGFELPLDVGNYLVRQFSRDLQELMSVMKILEQASVMEKRRVTLPFVKQVLTESAPAKS
ncbi:MAG: DnaA regulatory inactivator Hda [Hydrogenovibrio sp.]|uniref:DnaA regulatory inactivator Hda n=1 Tax=Hydrogenovibrio TaxID=28884 RepID=UPI0003639DB8|nr:MULTISPECIES: DnaA regulatory inactivator Hda [Hydrogenovibrio]MDR9497538.1 DnaA regulatory inactivator Hda [Hydrogenovibrio sp.]